MINASCYSINHCTVLCIFLFSYLHKRPLFYKKRYCMWIRCVKFKISTMILLSKWYSLSNANVSFWKYSVTAIFRSRFIKTGYCNLHCSLQFKLKRKKWNHRFLWREFQPFGISIHEIYTFPTNLHH